METQWYVIETHIEHEHINTLLLVGLTQYPVIWLVYDNGMLLKHILKTNTLHLVGLTQYPVIWLVYDHDYSDILTRKRLYHTQYTVLLWYR